MSVKHSFDTPQQQAIGLAFLLLALLYCADFFQIRHTGSSNLILLEALVVIAPFLAGILAQHLRQTTLFLLVVMVGKLAFDYLVFVFRLELFYSDIPALLTDWFPIVFLRLFLPVFFIGLGWTSYIVFSKLIKKTH